MIVRNDHASARDRAGITLTEILISLLIMSVGIVSVAALFPVGLERLRAAQRNVRSASLGRAAMTDIDAHNLFGAESFRVSHWTGGRDPFLLDTLSVGNTTFSVGDPVFRGPGSVGGSPVFVPGEGLPVAYDPLWWAQARNNDPNVDPRAVDGRFGSGLLQYPVRTDPDSRIASAHGLQRITSAEFLFPVDLSSIPDTAVRTAITGRDAYNASQVFATLDDPVLMTDGAPRTEIATNAAETIETTTEGSSVLPVIERRTDNSSGNVTLNTFNDWTFTWMFTGRRIGLTDSTYMGDVVIMHNRALAVDAIDVGGTTVFQPAGERVVEAVWSYGTTITESSLRDEAEDTDFGYSPRDRIVLLRWPASQPDPEIRVGSWIADVTYERNARIDIDRYYARTYPGQRCHWYRIAKRTDVVPGRVFSRDYSGTPENVPYREMTLTLETSVKARTLMGDIGGNMIEPVNVNVALINPSVVYVFEDKIIEAR